MLEDGTPVEPWTLIYRDEALEREYLMSQENTLYRAVMMGYGIGLCLSMLETIMLLVERGPSSLEGFGPVQMGQHLNIAFQVLCMAVLCSLPLSRRARQYLVLEALIIAGLTVAILLVVICDEYRSCLMFDENPEEVYNRGYFSDSSLLLYLDIIITMAHLFAPLRCRISWLIPVIAILSYTLFTAMIGSPEVQQGTDRTVVLIVQIMILGFVAWVGRHSSEKESRLLFHQQMQLRLAAESERNQMVQERVLRYSAERQLHEAHINPSSAAVRAPDTLTTLSSLSPFSSSFDASCQTDVTWRLDGFECRCCTKPPLSPQSIGTSSNRDMVGMVSAAERNPNLKKVILKRQRSLSSYKGANAMLQLPATPRSTVHSSLQRLLMMINSVNPDLCCCPWHAALQYLISCAQEIKDSECQVAWQPVIGKQCQHCFLLAYDAEDVCSSCGGQAFRGYNEMASSSHETLSWESLRLQKSQDQIWRKEFQRFVFMFPDDAILLCEADASADSVKACLANEVRAPCRLLALQRRTNQSTEAVLVEVCSAHVLDPDPRRPWFGLTCSQDGSSAEEVSFLVSSHVLTSTQTGLQCQQPGALALCETSLVGVVLDANSASKNDHPTFSVRVFGKSIRDHMAKKSTNTRAEKLATSSGTAIKMFRNSSFPMVGKSTGLTPSKIVAIELKYPTDQYLLVGCKIPASKPEEVGLFIALSTC